jgi:hypothetical protein
MSDSANGNARGLGAKVRGSTPAPASTLEREVAERFASAFVPVWQFDDAGFSVGEELSDEDIQVLDVGVDLDPIESLPSSSPFEGSRIADPGVSRGSGTFKIGSTSEAAATSVEPLPPTDPFPLVRDHAIGLEPSVVIFEEPIREPGLVLSATAPPVTAPTPALDDTEVFRLPPRKGLLIGIAASVAAIVAGLGIAVIRAEAPEPSTIPATTSRSTRAAEDIPIPPPLSPSEMSLSTPSVTEALPPPSLTANSPPPLASRSSRQATVGQRTKDPAHQSRSPIPSPKSPGKIGGGIVRANPF